MSIQNHPDPSCYPDCQTQSLLPSPFYVAISENNNGQFETKLVETPANLSSQRHIAKQRIQEEILDYVGQDQTHHASSTIYIDTYHRGDIYHPPYPTARHFCEMANCPARHDSQSYYNKSLSKQAVSTPQKMIVSNTALHSQEKDFSGIKIIRDKHMLQVMIDNKLVRLIMIFLIIIKLIKMDEFADVVEPILYVLF